MNSVRCRETDRLNEMRKRWEEEKEAMGRTLTRELKSLDKEFEVTKEQWENSMRGKLGREYAEKLAKEREAVRAERDRDIEAEIRRIRKATVQVELSCKERLEKQSKILKDNGDGRMMGIADKKSRWGARVSENVDRKRQLEDQKRRCEATMKALEDYMEKADNDIAAKIGEREDELARVVEEEERVSCVGGGNLKALKAEREGTDKMIRERRAEVERVQNLHKSRVDMMAKEHDKDLEAVERRVKIDVGLKEHRLQELKEEIEGRKVRLENLEAMVKRYRKRGSGNNNNNGSNNSNNNKRMIV